MEELVFEDITPVEIPVKVGTQQYVLREASGEAIAKWRNGITRGVSIGPDRRPTGIGAVGDSAVLLLSLCMYRTDESKKIRLDKDGNPSPHMLVGLGTVKQWPNRIVEKLFEEAKRISHINEEGVVETKESLEKQMEELETKMATLDREDPSKNGSSPTEDGLPLPAISDSH